MRVRRLGSWALSGSLAVMNGSCAPADQPVMRETRATFGSDLDFLRSHTEVILLTAGENGAQVAVAPEYQGRVMTSTASGASGPSFGWIHREAVRSRTRQPHINVFGGEDRFWLGPEGGQFSIFFQPGDPFDLEHWQVPEPIDWGGWEVASRSDSEVRFRKPMSLTNYSGANFHLEVERTVRLLTPAARAAVVPEPLPASVRMVAYESDNSIRNSGSEPWRKETGLLSIWILGMFPASDETTVAIPFQPGGEESLGPVVNDRYFGKVPADRLAAGEGVLFFRGDGRHRSKIGVARPRARPFLGSYDAAGRILTIVQFNLPDRPADYVNSMWERQPEPYRGDVVNSYNDGPSGPGRPGLGAFYELETSSPAAALAPGESLTHLHRTFHLTGEEAELDRVARAALGASLSEIGGALGARKN